MSAADLARAIQIAVSGFDDLKLKTDFIEDLARVVRLIVAGAVAPATSAQRKTKQTSVRKTSRKRK